LYDLLTNESVKSVISHELHHSVTLTNRQYGQFSGVKKDYVDNNFNTQFVNVDVTPENTKLKQLFYYLKKDELNSIIPQNKIHEVQYVIDMFKYYNSLPYDDFKIQFERAFPEKQFSNKLYKKIKDRTHYFLRKYHKTLTENRHYHEDPYFKINDIYDFEPTQKEIDDFINHQFQWKDYSKEAEEYEKYSEPKMKKSGIYVLYDKHTGYIDKGNYKLMKWKQNNIVKGNENLKKTVKICPIESYK
jgi:hypothetical protein